MAINAKGPYSFLGISLPHIVSIILAIIPVTAFLGSFIERIYRKKVILAILFFITFGFFGIGWLVDLISVVLKNDLVWLI